MSVNFLISLLKKGWNNIRTLHIKTSMGKAYRLYGWEERSNLKILYILSYDYLIVEHI